MTNTMPESSGPLVDIAARLEDLGAALALWATRDDSKAQPEVRQAANTAVDAIDGMLGELHRIRSRLVTEIRASDDATDARARALLARLRHEFPGGRS